MLDLMRFPQEVVKADEFELPKGNSKSYRVTPAELGMATQLIEAMTKQWNADDYQDEFRTKLRKIIDEQIARQKGKKVREKTEEAEPVEATTNVVDFMELLKRSLNKDGKKGGRAAPRKATRRRSTRRKAAS